MNLQHIGHKNSNRRNEVQTERARLTVKLCEFMESLEK